MASSAPHAAEGEDGAPSTRLRCTLPLHRCDTVGKLIVYYRKLKGWGQKQLLYATGLSQSRLSSLECDSRKPSLAEADRIAFCVEQPLDVFILLRRRSPQQLPAGTEATMARF